AEAGVVEASRLRLPEEQYRLHASAARWPPKRVQAPRKRTSPEHFELVRPAMPLSPQLSVQPTTRPCMDLVRGAQKHSLCRVEKERVLRHTRLSKLLPEPR